MFRFLILICGFTIYDVLARSHKYPAGLDPSLCPNYPHCDNALLAANSERLAAGTHAMATVVHHQGGGYFRHFPSYTHHYVPQAAPGYPVGLSPHACPNYPYCSHHIPPSHYGHGYPRSYPSGVSPHLCPNYPYCH